MNLKQQLLAVTDAYCEATGRSASRVSTLIFNDGKRIAAIRDGGDLATGRFEHGMAWYSANWPDGTQWPEGIARPEPLAVEESQAGATE